MVEKIGDDPAHLRDGGRVHLSAELRPVFLFVFVVIRVGSLVVLGFGRFAVLVVRILGVRILKVRSLLIPDTHSARALASTIVFQGRDTVDAPANVVCEGLEDGGLDVPPGDSLDGRAVLVEELAPKGPGGVVEVFGADFELLALWTDEEPDAVRRA